jgi:hypothetical protein
MPQTPEDLSRIIYEMARKHAMNRGKKLSDDAGERIGEIPPEYRSRPTISVDLGKLDNMVGDIIDLAAPLSGEQIGKEQIETALKTVKCHYLWFC